MLGREEGPAPGRRGRKVALSRMWRTSPVPSRAACSAAARLRCTRMYCKNFHAVKYGMQNVAWVVPSRARMQHRCQAAVATWRV